MNVGLFPGQGSLRPGMGVPWLDHPSAHVVDEIAELTGVDVVMLLTDAPGDVLVRTDNAQLATFALSATIADALSRHGVKLGKAIGHSLGEYSALHAAGILNLGSASVLVHARGAAMASAAEITPGTMAAILGADEEAVAGALAHYDGIVVANLNAPGQVVVAGPTEQVDDLRTRARELGLRKVMALEVGGAFHSPLMAPAAEELSKALTETNFLEGEFPVIANVDARSHGGGEHWRALLEQQLTAPVRFAESVANSSDDRDVFYECGPGGVLCGLVGRIHKGATTISIATPEDLEGLEV